jgi:hypothetical protein
LAAPLATLAAVWDACPAMDRLADGSDASTLEAFPAAALAAR